MTPQTYIVAAALAAIFFYAAVRLRRELQMLQQNSYRPGRYMRWLRGLRRELGVDIVTDLLMVGMLGGFFRSRWAVWAIAAIGLICLYKGVRRLRIRSKKPLVFTSRAVRLYIVGVAMVAAAPYAAIEGIMG